MANESNEQGEKVSAIWPYRFIPFDLGAKVSQEDARHIDECAAESGWGILPVNALMTSLCKQLLRCYTVDSGCTLYIYEFGIGVFVLVDQVFDMRRYDMRFAVDYCGERRVRHDDILRGEHPMSPLLIAAMGSVRACLEGGGRASRLFARRPHRRLTARDTWDPNGYGEAAHGLLYVMTLSWCDIDSLRKEDMDGVACRNLQIMLQPSLARQEDSPFFRFSSESAAADMYGADVLAEAREWKRREIPVDFGGVRVFASWAAVIAVPLFEGVDDLGVRMLEVMEANTQAIWMYTYCLRADAELSDADATRISDLVNDMNEYHLALSYYQSIEDASAPTYLKELLQVLIDTSGLREEQEKLETFVDRLESSISARNEDRQRKSDFIGEVLLFLLALTQLPSTLYSFIMGDYGSLSLPILIVMVVLTVLFIATVAIRGNR